MPRATPLALCVLLAVPLGGCCSFARFFCGPDRTPWVSVDHSSPESTVRTFLEALRRDDPDVVYDCFSNDYRVRLGIDKMAVQVAWDRFREANPGLHVAGYAEVPVAQRPSPDRAIVSLDVEGIPFEVQLVRIDRWVVRYERPQEPGKPPFPPGRFVQPLQSFAGHVRSEAHSKPDHSTLSLSPLVVRHDGIDELGIDTLEFVGLERTWRITDLQDRRPR